jgi:digeranylgeranylglycerophospholipid reductase
MVVSGMGYEFIGVRQIQPRPPSVENCTPLHISPGISLYVIPRGRDRFGVEFGVLVHDLKGKVSFRDLWGRCKRHLEDTGRYNFSKAYPLSLTAGTTCREVEFKSKRLVSDGLILIGDAAWRPLIGSRYGSSGMTNAIGTGRFAAEVAAQAIKDGDVSEKSLSRYLDKCEGSLKGMGAKVREADGLYSKVMQLNSDTSEKAVGEIGALISAMHFFKRGGLALEGCVEPVRKWLEREKV